MKVLGPQGTVTDIKLSLSPAEAMDQLTTTLKDNANALAQRVNAKAQADLANAQAQWSLSNADYADQAMKMQEQQERERIEQDANKEQQPTESQLAYPVIQGWNQINEVYFPLAEKHFNSKTEMPTYYRTLYSNIAKNQYSSMGIDLSGLRDGDYNYSYFDQFLRRQLKDFPEILIKVGTPAMIQALVQEYKGWIGK